MTGGTRLAGDRTEALAPYDETVPGPPRREDLAARFARLRELRGADPDLLCAVREVVLVVGSSRGGSTLLSELLRRTPELVTLPGEVNPYVVVAQLSGQRRRTALAGELAAELGRPVRPGEQVDRRDLALSCAWRMAAQWPTVRMPVPAVEAAVRRLLAAGSPGVGRVAAARFTGALLAELRTGSGGRVLDLRRYDLPGEMLREQPPPAGPVADVVVEMTPYRLVEPWQRAGADELAGRTVVLATPRNSFRIDHLAGLFPAARVRLLHLTRNPAGAVNGLVDGWRHHAFHNCRMPVELDIAGYTDRFPGWGRRWWKYDVPPGWQSVLTAPLPRVAALQWSTAHEAVLAAGGREVHRLAYEDLVGPPAARRRAAAELAGWLGLAEEADFTARVCRGLDPVMATAPPRPARWRDRACELRDVLADPAVLELAERLGYRPDPTTWL